MRPLVIFSATLLASCAEREGWKHVFFYDADGDGWGDPATRTVDYERPPGFVWGYASPDCDDANPAIHPLAEETCNLRDDDCDGDVDEGVTVDWYRDADGDGYGDPETVLAACTLPAGYLPDSQDCDDTDPEVHPGADDPCNGVDNDCSGDALELDDDEDGLSDCEGDCLDDEDAAYPGAQEVCDGLDDDCDGALPGDEADVDGDGEMACEGDCDDTDRTSAHLNVEVCDGVDNDCNGIADDACIVCDIAIPNDFGSIQEGLDAASTGAVVCVGPGTWSGPIHFNGVDVTLLGTRGPLETIIDGGGDGSAVKFASGEGPLTKMQGFTVEGGHPLHPPADCGGGVRIVGASPTIVDLVVQDNRSEGWGGGICVDSGDPTFSHLLVQENYAYYGGGVYLIHSNVSLDNVTISSNEGGADAGGLCAQDSTVSLTNARIVSNSTSGDGGGAWFTSTDAVLTNVVIMSNSADLDAGLIGDGGSTVTIANSTIAYNSSERGAVGVAMSDEATAELRNVVFVYNTAINNVDAPPSEYSQYSDFYGNSDNGSGGADNLAVDPLLYADAEHLESSSPLVDAGDPAIFDPDGSRSDIGAFGGPGADNWDLDGDGYPAWWLAGAYDAATSPGSDCDDDDAAVYPGAGC